MSSRILSCTLVAVLAFLVPADVHAGDWPTYRSPNNDFSVKLPAKPKMKKQQVPIGTEMAETTTWFAVDKETGVAVGVATLVLPREVADVVEDNPEEAMDALIDGILAGTHGERTASRKVQMGDNVGLEFEASVLEGEGHAIGRVFLIDGKVFVLMVVAPLDTPLTDEAEQVFDSFKVITTL